MIMGALGVLFVIGSPLGLVLLWLLFRRGPERLSRSRAPRPWHPAVRIVCGVLGIGLLIALGVGTWREVRGVYDASLQTQQPTLHLPAKPAPTLPTPTQPLAPGGVRILPLSDARVLFHMVLLQETYPLHAEELDVRFPEDAGKKLERRFEHRGVQYRVTMTLKGLVAHCFEDSPVRLFADGNFNLESCSGGGSWSREPGGFVDHSSKDGIVIRESYSGDSSKKELGGLVDLSSKHEMDRGIVNTTKKPWSVVHSSVSAPVLVFQARLVERDDPLKPATLVEVAGREGSAEHDGLIVTTNMNPFDIPPPFYRLMEALGVSFIILIGAAVLLAQVFVRRGLAFAGMLALCLGYAAALDRMAVGFHSRKLADKQQPMQVRVVAADALHSIYFYKDTACRAAERPVQSCSSLRSAE